MSQYTLKHCKPLKQADRAVGCNRCGKPCALVGDWIPLDGLCPWCRASDAPKVHDTYVTETKNMTSQKQADDESLWPEGTDVGGIRAMCYGLLTWLMRGIAIYAGTANARGLVRSLDGDLEFWNQCAQMSPVLRDVLRQQDEMGRALDLAERQHPKDS